MLSVQGYFDGEEIKPLEKMNVKRNQKVIITIMDDFVKPEQVAKSHNMRGALARYANPSLQAKETGAWERAMVDKHGHA